MKIVGLINTSKEVGPGSLVMASWPYWIHMEFQVSYFMSGSLVKILNLSHFTNSVCFFISKIFPPKLALG